VNVSVPHTLLPVLLWLIIEISQASLLKLPVTVAERSKACTVFARSEAGIVGSNPTQGMGV
jgi:hypothetical protein